MGILYFCQTCKDLKRPPLAPGYTPYKVEMHECMFCGSEDLIDTGISGEEYSIIRDTSKDVSFLEAMIKLKKDDIIEYQSRISQFKTQIEQQKQIQTQEKESNKIKCPTCSSTNVQKISGFERGTSVAFWGLFSKKINKSFKCNGCGYMW